MLRMVPVTISIALAATALVSCSDPVSGPRSPLRADKIESPEVGATVFGNATVRWNAIARAQTLTHIMSQQAGVRAFAYLSLAQFNAAVAAQQAERDDGSEPPSVPAAIAGASAAVLASFFPDQAAYFDAQAALGSGEEAADFPAGVALGRAIGASSEGSG